MFANPSQWKQYELRQGDVLAGIPFPFTTIADHRFIAELGPTNHQGFPSLIAKMHALGQGQDQSYFSGQLAMKMGFCAILTHCCELVANSNHKLKFIAAISVCRLIPLLKSMQSDPQKLASVMGNSDPRKGEGYKNYFYYGSGGALGPEPLMADFNQTTCIPATEFPKIMENKIIQLDDRTRMKFKIKLGLSCAKPTDEERDAGIHEDPWKEQEGTT